MIRQADCFKQFTNRPSHLIFSQNSDGAGVNKAHDSITRSVKGLSLSAIEKAKSGHTSFPLGMADVGYELFADQMNFQATDPTWINRDRLVLSSGHGSMFLYAFLHLFGYKISIDDIKQFRQIGSITPGHPEFGVTEGVECTTGPLGQGIANAVGMALSAAMLSAKFNTREHRIFDHYIYCLCGDGDLMEGVAMEAISFAGHHQLEKLIVIYDYNEITIDGRTNLTYTEHVAEKIASQRWHVIEIDGHDQDEIHSAVEEAKLDPRPSMIIAKTISGKGAVNWEGSNKIHGNPMKPDDYNATFAALELDRFAVVEDAYEVAKSFIEAKKFVYDKWQETFAAWKIENPELAKSLQKMMSKDCSDAINTLEKLSLTPNAATRTLNGEILSALAETCEQFVGGSADLAGSNNTTLAKSTFVEAGNFAGRNIHFGVREHAMGGIMNGIAYHGLLRPYGGTFLVFSDYMRPSVRLAALSHLPTIYVWTHDSFYVGEDGPTHHPVEHVSSLRLIPNLVTFRPAGGDELKSCWKYILNETKRPVALCLTRQNLDTLDKNTYALATAEKGAYILKEAEAELKFIVVASGSEVSLVAKAVASLPIAKHTRLISMPSMELFEEQSTEYKASLFPRTVKKRLAVEAGRSGLWWKYVGEDGHIIAMDTFSQSAPYQSLEKAFGFTVENVVSEISAYLK